MTNLVEQLEEAQTLGPAVLATVGVIRSLPFAMVSGHGRQMKPYGEWGEPGLYVPAEGPCMYAYFFGGVDDAPAGLVALLTTILRDAPKAVQA